MNDINLNRTMSVDEYHDLINAGVLTENDAVELIEGRIVEKMPKKPGHPYSTGQTRSSLERLLQLGWHVNSQDPITLEDSEPEPDVTVIEGEGSRYKDRHPGPVEVALVGEVAESSLRFDQTVKKTMYARARIPVYWIVNLVDRQVEVYTAPSGPAEQPDYGQCDIYRAGDEVPVVIRGREIGRVAVNAILP